MELVVVFVTGAVLVVEGEPVAVRVENIDCEAYGDDDELLLPVVVFVDVRD